MEQDILISGYGGQGVKSIAHILGHAATKEGKYALLYNVYGGQIRGGPISSTIVIADSEVGSPLRASPWALIAMNQAALDLYESDVQTDGLIVVNRSLIKRPLNRLDVRLIEVPANEAAVELGDIRVVSMFALGVFVEKTGIISLETAKEVLAEVFPSYRHQFLPLNRKALDAGFRYGKDLN